MTTVIIGHPLGRARTQIPVIREQVVDVVDAVGQRVLLGIDVHRGAKASDAVGLCQRRDGGCQRVVAANTLHRPGQCPEPSPFHFQLSS